MRRSRLFLFPGISASAFALAALVFAQAPNASKEHQSTIKPTAIHFEDIAQQVGLTALNSYGGDKHKEFIIESTGNGAVVFDYDNDGWPDIFLPDGSRVEGFGSHMQDGVKAPASAITTMMDIEFNPNDVKAKKAIDVLQNLHAMNGKDTQVRKN